MKKIREFKGSPPEWARPYAILCNNRVGGPLVQITGAFHSTAQLDTLIAYLRDEARPWLEEQEKKQ